MRDNDDDLIPTRWTLIGRLKDWDDQESWREFFDTYWRLVYGVARRAGLSPQDAQDIVQETVVSVCKGIERFRAEPERGSFKGWLLTITRNRIIDLQRKRQRAAAVSVPAPPSSTRSTAFEDRVVDPAGNGFDAAWDAEWERNLVSLALERLERKTSARHYQVFLLHVIQQHPADKVAKATGIPASQVYLIKHRLQPEFREALQQLEAKMSAEGR
jgi:RNA polymerase sigma factor (sigma-70 family)